METREEILKSPEYWLQDAQLDLFEQVSSYLRENHINQTEFASQLNVSKGYISQILNGDLNCTLKKLMELSLAIGKVPKIKYTSIENIISNDANNVVFLDGEFNQGITLSPQPLRLVYKNGENEAA